MEKIKKIQNRIKKFSEEEKYIEVSFKVNSQELSTKLAKFLDYLSYCGNVGHTTQITDNQNEFSLCFDGDGNDRLEQIVIDNRDIDKYFSILEQQNILKPEERKWFNSNGFEYNVFGDDKNSYQYGNFRDGNYIDIELSDFDDKNLKWFLCIYYKSKRMRFKDRKKSIEDFITFDSFKDLQKYIKPLLGKTEYDSTEVNYENLPENVKEDEEY